MCVVMCGPTYILFYYYCLYLKVYTADLTSLTLLSVVGLLLSH